MITAPTLCEHRVPKRNTRVQQRRQLVKSKHQIPRFQAPVKPNFETRLMLGDFYDGFVILTELTDGVSFRISLHPAFEHLAIAISNLVFILLHVRHCSVREIRVTSSSVVMPWEALIKPSSKRVR